MAVLQFPDDRVVGTLDWFGSWSVDRGPVLATGLIEVPDDQEIGLHVQEVTGTERHGDSWQIGNGTGLSDLGFLTQLAPSAFTSLTLGQATPESYSALGHLTPGLRKLYLSWSDLTDDVLPYVAKLTRLEYLQTFGNAFTDDGVQVLSALTSLVWPYLEEETLTAAAFRFASQLPRLERLGLQDVPISEAELTALRAELPGVAVG